MLSYVRGLQESGTRVTLSCHDHTPDGPGPHRFPLTDVIWHMVEEELQH
jgi:hypothetical protein